MRSLFNIKPSTGVLVEEFDKSKHMHYAKDIMDYDEELTKSQELFAPGKIVNGPSLGRISYEKYIDLLLDNDWRIFVITLGDKCIGYFHLGLGKYERSTYIGSFIITKKYRGKGYGTQAFAQLKELIRNEYDLVILYVYSKNQSAKKLYQKVGFEENQCVMSMSL